MTMPKISDLYTEIMIRTYDPSHLFSDGHPMPALTTLLVKVCDQDQTKFEEATRLIELFMDQLKKEL